MSEHVHEVQDDRQTSYDHKGSCVDIGGEDTHSTLFLALVGSQGRSVPQRVHHVPLTHTSAPR